MKKLLILLVTIIAILNNALDVDSITQRANNLNWENIENGLDFVSVDFAKGFRKGKIYALKLQKPRQLQILLDGKSKPTTIERLEKKYKPLAVFNGSYFDENFLPVGLLKVDNHILYGLNKYGNTGILAINQDKLDIFNKKDIDKYKNKYDNLMQSGPILVEENGKSGIYSDNHEYSARTSIAINRKNETLIVIADSSASPSLWEFAQVLIKDEKKGGFSVKLAINLDGGSSTGLRINSRMKKLILSESSYISNGIGIF